MGDSKVYFVIQLFLMHWVEIRRYQDMEKAGSVNQDPIFKKYELPEDNKPGYPGGIFDPFGWTTRKNGPSLEELQLKEIKNGRVASLAGETTSLTHSLTTSCPPRPSPSSMRKE